jgi:hypothetical protein
MVMESIRTTRRCLAGGLAHWVELITGERALKMAFTRVEERLRLVVADHVMQLHDPWVAG